MIIIKLTGGLGNQLFQYAKGKALAYQNKTTLALDISWYKGRLSRKYMLDNFNIQAKIASRFNIITTQIFNKNIYIDTSKNTDWQSVKYLRDIENTIKKEFSTKTPLSQKNQSILEDIKSKNSVSIHLRGGDYVVGSKSTFHGVCTPEYYSKAIDYIKQNILFVHFFIFTDDLKWAKKHINFPEPYTIVSDTENPPWEEMIMMSHCKHNIIANSTFSWWGAYLNNNPEKIVIAPRKWFNNESINTEDLIPKKWIRI